MVTPRELLSRVLLALLDAGDLALGDCSAGEGGTRCLVRLALRGFPDAATRQALAASALVGLSQVQRIEMCSHCANCGGLVTKALGMRWTAEVACKRILQY